LAESAGQQSVLRIIKLSIITKLHRMPMIRVTGSQIAAARALACLSRQELATRAGLSYHSIRAWERSSNSIPEATYSHLCRALEALEATGVRFTDGGVYLQRPAPPATVIHSEGATA
jgi:transcriptional regulator with XRE-family HTH domain